MANIEYHEIKEDGSVEEVSMEELKKRAMHRFFTWLKKVGELAGWSTEETAKRVEDPSWFYCYDDGMKPEDAVAEAKSKGVI